VAEQDGTATLAQRTWHSEQGMALGIRTGLTYLEHIQNRSSRAAEAFLRMLRRVEPVMDAATFTEALCIPLRAN